MTILRGKALAAMGLCALLLLASCKKETEQPRQQDAGGHTVSTPKPAIAETQPTASLHIAFLWHDRMDKIEINDDYVKKMSAAEKAALGYVATFIGSECDWDGPYTDKRDNLKCRILTALDLGYQCSDKHLGFLRQWFRKDAAVLKELENCPTVPYTATSQEFFDRITIKTTENTIHVLYTVSGVNLREQETWCWASTDYFEFDHNSIKLVKQEKTEVKREHFEAGE